MAQDRAEGELERRLDSWARGGEIALRTELQHKLSGQLKKTLGPVKPLPSNGARAVRFVAVFIACAVVLMAVLDKAGFHLMTAVQMGVMAVVLASGGVYIATRLASWMVPGSPLVTRIWLGLVVGLLGVGGAMDLLFPWRTEQAFVEEGWPCAALELTIAVPAVVVFWLMARRGVLFASAGLGAELTAMAVFLALMVDQTQCMFPQAPHLLVWHGGVAAVLIGTGALIGRAMERRMR